MQVLRVLPDSIFYGRHLLREGDYVTSVNGKSVERLTTTECDELLTPRSTVVRIELLRKIDPGTPDDDRTGPEFSCNTPRMERLATEDERLDRDEGPSPRRRSLPNELNQNELFARSKLRLSYRSGFDRDSLRNGRDREPDFVAEERGRRTSSGRSSDFARKTGAGR